MDTREVSLEENMAMLGGLTECWESWLVRVRQRLEEQVIKKLD